MAFVVIPSGIPRLDEIQERVLQVLDAALPTSAGWRRTVFTPDILGRDGGPGGGRLFGVELGETVISKAVRVRRGTAYAGQPLQAETKLMVRWLLVMAADGLAGSYALGLQAEHRVVGALLNGTMTTTGMHEIAITSMRRDMAGDGSFLLGTISASISHPYAIEVDDGTP